MSGVSVAGIRALWTGAPWTLRIYVALGAAGQLWCAIAYRNPYSAISVLVLLAVSYLLLKGARWAWIAMVALTSAYLASFLVAWWVVSALSYFVSLALLLAPSTRRHFAGEPFVLPSTQESRIGRVRSGPPTLQAFAACLLVYWVGGLILFGVHRLDEKPGRVALTLILAVVVCGAIAYFVVRGARVAWSIAVALLCAVAAATTANGHWVAAAVPAALLLLLLLPGSVAFVWRDRRVAT